MRSFSPVFLALAMKTLANAEPMVTAAALVVRQNVDPGLVGYISTNGRYTDGRTCDYPMTVSTSGGYVQCCASTGTCRFYTACSANTLLAAGTNVPCDVNAALTCNTALVYPTAGANNPGSYLACWQRTLGASAFTMVQNTQAASAVPTTTSSSASMSTTTGTAASASAVTTGAVSVTSTTSDTGPYTVIGSGSVVSTAVATSRNAAPRDNNALSGGIVGFVAVLAQAIL